MSAVLVRSALGAVPVTHDGVEEERGGFVGEEAIIAAAITALLHIVAFLVSRSGAVSVLLCFVWGVRCVFFVYVQQLGPESER